MDILLSMRDLERITANLAALMEERGLNSQVKLAAAAGISQTNLSNIMRCAVSPTLETLSALANALHVDTWQLLAPPDTTRLLRLYASSSPADQAMIDRLLRSLASPPAGS